MLCPDCYKEVTPREHTVDDERATITYTYCPECKYIFSKDVKEKERKEKENVR